MGSNDRLADVDPVIAGLQKQAKEAGCGQADPLSSPIGEARAQQSKYFKYVNRDLPAIDGVRDIAIPADGREIPARLYMPRNARSDFFVAFARGAGWWAGDLDSHEAVCRATANAVGRPLVAIDYRRAPEHRFPAQRDDVARAVEWLAAHAGEHRLGSGRAVLWGESAGASLCVLAWDRLKALGRADGVMGLVLYYGNLGGPRENLRAQSKWVWRQYLGERFDAPPQGAVPQATDLSGCPPVWLGVGDADPLIEDSIGFSDALRAAGIRHELEIYPGMPHAFTAYTSQSPVAGAALADAAGFAGRLSPGPSA